MMEKILIICNPSSGQKDSEEIGRKLKQVFAEQNVSSTLYLTSKNEDYRTLVTNYLEKGFLTVVILGGDGTISEFVNQISELKKRPKIILLPLGTVNNFARSLGTELNLNRLVEKIRKKQLIEKQVDIGVIGDHYFISSVSVGSIPEISWQADDDVKEAFGPFGYILEGLNVLANQETFKMTLRLDGKGIELDDVVLMIVALSNSVFGIPTFFKNATYNNGKLQLFILKDDSVIRNMASFAQAILNDESKNRQKLFEKNGVFTTSFKKGEFASEVKMNLAVDGEKGQKFPVQLSVLQQHLTFLVPES